MTTRLPSAAERTRCRLLLATILSLAAAAAPGATSDASGYATQSDPRLEAMKADRRGPFAAIRWFCKDGTRLPPEPDACKPHGGGSQHGEWSKTTLELRENGFLIANFFADLDIDALLATPDASAQLAQMGIERFLIRADDGWILRQARYYRGAYQDEGERKGADRLLRALAARPDWISIRYLQLRSLAALVPHGPDTPSAKSVRQLAAALAARDARFMSLRNKIHAAPSANDASNVRAYAATLDNPALASEFEALAAAIDALYARSSRASLKQLDLRDDSLKTAVTAYLAVPDTTAARYIGSAALLAAMRDALARTPDSGARLALLDASLQVEADHFIAATEIAPTLASATRRARLELLRGSIDALYGTGLLSPRQRGALTGALNRLNLVSIELTAYRATIDYLAHAPHWGERHFAFQFGPGIDTLARIEPLARQFVPDQLRGSPLFFYAAVIDGLLRDANALAGVSHRLFEQDTSAGARALNPGLARGVLRDGRGLNVADFKSDGIYLLPETTADLPPVAGIITAGSGNPLSHVQLLARNLGIPNVAVDGAILELLSVHRDEAVVLAVSAGGVVRLLPDGPEFDAVFARQTGSVKPRIEPELDKLDLEQRGLIDLADLRAADSGRTVGPKAAKLGELKAHFPEAVANGVAIPFGAFRALLERPSPTAGMTMAEYIVAGYRALDALPADAPSRAAATDTFRQSLYDWVAGSAVDPVLAAELEAALTLRLGSDRSYGVFVRSDTNVEDLPGFTGAGLNLTVPNVVGMNAILAAIPQVWASPFTARAFSWRQALMREPEHVYPAVLLLESVDVAKSGVLVTQDIDTGDRSWLSVAINEGVGGAVDGQSAESLRIHLDTGEVRLMAQASAPTRRQVNPAGGFSLLPASGTDAVLVDGEFAQLIAFARELPARFPPIVDADGKAAPADVEFGFQDGKLRLFQLRPFLDNPAARRNQYLIGMDPSEASLRDIKVVLDATLN